MPTFNLFAYQQLHLKKNNSAVRSFRAPLYSANLLLLLVRSPIKQSMDFLIDTLEHDVSSPVHRALDFGRQQRGAFWSALQNPALLSPSELEPLWHSSLSFYVALLTIISR